MGCGLTTPKGPRFPELPPNPRGATPRQSALVSQGTNIYDVQPGQKVLNYQNGAVESNQPEPPIVAPPPAVPPGNAARDLSFESDSVLSPEHGLFGIFPLNPAKITREYRIHPVVLGRGAFGVVRKCTHLVTGQERAIKIIVKDDFGRNQSKSIAFLKEIEILKGLSHPNLVNIHEYFQDEQYLFIVMELVRGIELLDRILNAGRLSEQETSIIMEQLVNVVNYMHSKGVVHRDIKPENILVDGKSIKLIDFGGARYFKPGKPLTKLSGTAFYVAPEVIRRSYDNRCDVWSVGVLMYTMLTGEPPFPGKEDDAIFEKILRGKYKADHPGVALASEQARDLLQKLLTHDYRQRPQIWEVIDHPWFTRVRANSVPLPADIMNNLRKFSSGSPFQKAIFFYLIHNVASNVERRELIVAFGQLDRNHDGVLSRDEIAFGLQQVGVVLAPDELQEVMNRVGGPGATAINYLEFLSATMDRAKLLSEERLQQCFKQFDQDHTGRISIHNFRAMLGTKVFMADDQWREVIRDYDTNGDGVIEYGEFREILIKLSAG